jgi:hypothetical protein
VTFSLSDPLWTPTIWFRVARGCTCSQTSNAVPDSRVLNVLSGMRARSKNGGTDAHDRCALPDGRLEIVCHSHGQVLLAEAARLFPFQCIPQFTESGEVRLCQFGIFEIGGQCHETVQADSFQRKDRGDDLSYLARVGAEFGFFLPEVDLNQDGKGSADFSASPAQPGGQPGAVDRVYDIEQLRCAMRLVRLEVPDQMPLELIPVAQGSDFRFRLLDAVLAETVLAGRNRFFDRFSRKGFADGDKPDTFRGPPSLMGCSGDAIADYGDVSRYIAHGFEWPLQALEPVVGEDPVSAASLPRGKAARDATDSGQETRLNSTLSCNRPFATLRSEF